jgi:hypothetical protein
MVGRSALAWGSVLVSGYVHAASVSFLPMQRGDRWPRVELRRDAKDSKGALEGRVTLRQVTNPQSRFGPYLTAKEVGSLELPAGRASARVALGEVLRVPLSSLVPGRYELEVQLLGSERAVIARGVASIDEAAIEALVNPAAKKLRGEGVPSVDGANAEGSTESHEVDPKLVTLDARELATLPSEEARKTAKVFAIVLAARDGETLRQMIPQGGLKTDKGTMPHPELERQLAAGMDPLFGPPPKAPWHVQFDRAAADRFTMRPSARASQSVTFERGADGHWRVGQVSKKKSLEGE